jgi:hypothetical protein
VQPPQRLSKEASFLWPSTGALQLALEWLHRPWDQPAAVGECVGVGGSHVRTKDVFEVRLGGDLLGVCCLGKVLGHMG